MYDKPMVCGVAVLPDAHGALLLLLPMAAALSSDEAGKRGLHLPT